jgi:protein translocase SecG subunit
MWGLILFLMIISWILFIASVLLMSPKWGLGFWIGGISTSNEYGSKKSVEYTLKKTAVISLVIFTLTAIIYPYLWKESLSTSKIRKESNSNSKVVLSWNLLSWNTIKIINSK